MSYEIGECWGAYTTTDEFGRIGKVIGYYTSDYGARRAAKNRGWYNGDGSVMKHPVIFINDNIFLLADIEAIEISETPELAEVKKINILDIKKKLSSAEWACLVDQVKLR